MCVWILYRRSALLLFLVQLLGSYGRCPDYPSSQIRLVNGTSPREGTLEVCHNGYWGTVCDDSFGSVDATVVCRQLGFHGGTVHGSAYFGQGSGAIWMDDVRCWGTESYLTNCPFGGWGVHDCSHSEDVGVSCTLADGVRLVGGSTPLEGRLEVYHNHQWGTVCDDAFGSTDAKVVCKMLGFYGGTAHDRAYYGQGSGQIWMDEVQCSGNERYLSNCNFGGWGVHDCRHSEDVGVSCTLSDGVEVRLVGGSTSLEGRLEVYHDNQWGTVCDDGFGSSDAKIVCKMLGFYGGRALSSIVFGRGVGPIWMDEIKCNGLESSLEECPFNGWGQHDCTHDEDVGVSCIPIATTTSPKTTTTSNWNYSVRLVGGSSRDEGRLEVYHEGIWGTVCDDSFGPTEATVVCSILGYRSGTAYFSAHYGRGSGTIWMDNVDCYGGETSLDQCNFNGWNISDCTHNEDVGIECHSDYGISDDQDYRPYTSSSTSVIVGSICGLLGAIVFVILLVCLAVRCRRKPSNQHTGMDNRAFQGERVARSVHNTQNGNQSTQPVSNILYTVYPMSFPAGDVGTTTSGGLAGSAYPDAPPAYSVLFPDGFKDITPIPEQITTPISAPVYTSTQTPSYTSLQDPVSASIYETINATTTDATGLSTQEMTTAATGTQEPAGTATENGTYLSIQEPTNATDTSVEELNSSAQELTGTDIEERSSAPVPDL